MTVATSSPGEVLDAVAAIWVRRKEEVLRRVDVLDSTVLALLEGELGEQLRQEAAREAHKLAGSVGTFGFAHASRVARELEHLLDTPAPLDPSRVPRLSELVVDLRQELGRSPAGAPAAFSRAAATGAPAAATSRQKSTPTPRSLLVVENDEDCALRIVAGAAAGGLGAGVAGSPAAARRAIAGHRPDLVLLGVGSDHERQDALSLISELTAQQLPVLVLTSGTTFTDRVEAARHGAVGFLDRTLPPPQLLEAVHRALSRTEARSETVLAVDDDPSVLEALEVLLGSAGLQVRTLGDPRALFEELEESAPDLLVLDFDLPHADGVEICQALRSTPRWGTLPVVFLTGRTDSEAVHRIFRAGADDYLTKPVVGPELVARVSNRLERVRLLRELADTDPLTGVLNRRRSTELLEHHLQAADRFGQPLSLAVLDLDHFKAVNDRHGHACGDEVLRRVADLLRERFRGEDVVARWGGEEFVVGMYGMPKEDGVRRLDDLRRAVRGERFGSADGLPFDVSFSAGVARYPEDGKDLAELYRDADQALYQAKTSGKDRILPAGADPALPCVVDVALVEDDEVLAGLILHALETRGWSTHWLRDGREAAALLVGPLAPRLVLLDWDLPSLNGLAVLGAMAESGVLKRTRAVMLTARSTEAETLQALELGAVDHVAKPFSVPVLMQRVRRALES